MRHVSVLLVVLLSAPWGPVVGYAVGQVQRTELPKPPEALARTETPTEEIRQVQIQVWISETGEQGLRDLGANLTYTRFVRGIESSGSVQQISTNVQAMQKPDYNVVLPVPDQTLFPPPLRPDPAGTLADGIQAQKGVGLSSSLIVDDHGTIDMVFRALEQKSDLDLIAKPELLVINGQEAEIHAGARVPYQSIVYKQGRPELHVAWEPIGVYLKLTPVILDGASSSVQLNINTLAVSDVTRIDNVRGVDLPVFSTRSQSGTVLVPNGETLVIGGLTTRVIRRTERRVPVVGNLPLVGIPFRGRRSDATTSHLLVFVRPTIVDLREMDETAESALEFWRRERWRHQPKIDEELRLFKDDL